MAVVTGGINNGPVDYKFEFSFQHCRNVRVGKLALSDNHSHNGDRWQLEATKSLEGDSFFLECKLHLVASSNAKKKVAQISIFADGEMVGPASTATFSHSGANCDLHTFSVDNRKDQKIVVEVFTNSNTIEPPKTQMYAEVLDWFQSEDFGDTTIVAADGQKFYCHRAILSRRSEVFQLMFNSGMKEARNNLIVIEDFDGQIVAALLQFLYTDHCGEIGPIANHLYAAADKYQMKRLKILCEAALAANLSAKSIVKTYRLAKFYHLDQLMAICVDYLDSNKAEMSTAELLSEAIMGTEEPEAKRSRNE